MQIAQLSMLLWAFFENSYAGEDLWHSFLTQHLNFPFFPSGISHSWVFDSLGVGSISNERVQFKPRAEGHFDNAFSVPPKTLSIFSCLHCLSEFRSATSVIFFFFFLGGADRTCLTRNKHLWVKVSQEACMTLKLQRDDKPNKPQCWKHSQYVCSFQTQRSIMVCTECRGFQNPVALP